LIEISYAVVKLQKDNNAGNLQKKIKKYCNKNGNRSVKNNQIILFLIMRCIE